MKLTIPNFGREAGPAVLGWIFAAHQLGAAVFAALAGVSRDDLGTYVPAFLTAGILCLIAAAGFTLVRRPAQPPPLTVAA